MKSIVVVEDDHLLKLGLRCALGRVPGMRYFEAECLEGDSLIRTLKPDVVLSGVAFALTRMGCLQAQVPKTKWLLIAGKGTPKAASHAIRLGAHGLLGREASPNDYREAVVTVGQGLRLANTTREVETRTQQEAKSICHLSDRELQVFMGVAKGAMITDIARLLSVSSKTVETYRKRAMRKLGLRNSSQVTYFAMKQGLID